MLYLVLVEELFQLNTMVLYDGIHCCPFACEHSSTLSVTKAVPSIRLVNYKYLSHNTWGLLGIGSVLATYPQSDLLSNLCNNEVYMTSKDFVNINLMLKTSVILLVANDGEIPILVNSHR